MVITVSETPEPAACVGLTAPLEGVKAVNSHWDSLKQFFDVVSLAESVQKRRRSVSLAAAMHVDFEQPLRFCGDRGVQPLFLAINLDLCLVDRDPDGYSESQKV